MSLQLASVYEPGWFSLTENERVALTCLHCRRLSVSQPRPRRSKLSEVTAASVSLKSPLQQSSRRRFRCAPSPRRVSHGCDGSSCRTAGSLRDRRPRPHRCSQRPETARGSAVDRASRGLDEVGAVLQPAVDAVDADRPLGGGRRVRAWNRRAGAGDRAGCDAFEAHADRVVTLCGGESDAAPQVRADGGISDRRDRTAAIGFHRSDGRDRSVQTAQFCRRSAYRAHFRQTR